jgi:diguanylate cyclase (GGDEF)-like protein
MCGDDVGFRFEAEMISAIFLCIIWIYSYGANTVNTMKNRIFRVAFFVTALTILSNALCLPLEFNHFNALPEFVTASSYLHIIVYPLVSLTWQLYTIAFVHEISGKSVKRPFLLSLVPYIAYLFLVAANSFTGMIFTVDASQTVVPGQLYWILYAIHYFYSLTMILEIGWNRKLLPNDVRRIVFFFPLMVGAFTFIQQLVPQVLLEGSGAVCILLTGYLYLQNKRIYEDQLTSLPNRAAYIKTLKMLTEKKSPMIILSISLNDFKFINDKFGQDNGDLLLKSVASFLQRNAPLSKVYRCGGDKFAVIFEENQFPSAETDICKISDRFQQPWDIPECSCHLGAAMGVAHFPTTADNLRELVSTLESAVDHAKGTGSKQPVFCDRGTLDRVRRRYYIKNLIAAALENDSFEVYFQPIYSIKDNRFSEAEALLRLRDEDGKFVPPDEFIPLAEEAGLIVDIGYVVVDKVCKYIRSLVQSGVKIHTVSINLSVVQLMKADIVTRLLEIIQKNEVSPERIIFEVTESILVNNYAAISEKVKELCQYGIRFALDDFGTGYSNLTYVIDLPFQLIKIDKSLITNSMSNNKCHILVRDLTKSFRSMDFTVIAEGVELPEHDEFVRHCGFDRIQGYRYARPIPAADAIRYFGRSPEELE